LRNRYQAAGDRKLWNCSSGSPPSHGGTSNFLGHYAFRNNQHPIDLEAILAWINGLDPIPLFWGLQPRLPEWHGSYFMLDK
jgi:hypothetical protein